MTIYDGPNKVKKRWAIGIFALAGLLETINQLPQWVSTALYYLAGAI